MKLRMAVLALALVGCSKEEKQPDNAPAPAATVPKDGIEIISDGAAPKKLLRYNVAKGTKSPIELAVDMDVDAGIKQVTPTLVITMDVGVDDVTTDGKMKLRSTISDVTARDRPGSISAAMLKGQLDMMKDTTMTATLGPDGSFKDAAFEAGKKTPGSVKEDLGSMTSNMERIAMQLPQVPVGMGAKWRASKTIEQNGMSVTTVTTYEVTGIDGDKITYKTTVAVSGPDQSVSMGGISARVTNISGSGTGSGTMDLAKLAVSGTQNVSFAASMEAAGDKTQLKTTMTMTMTPKS